MGIFVRLTRYAFACDLLAFFPFVYGIFPFLPCQNNTTGNEQKSQILRCLRFPFLRLKS